MGIPGITPLIELTQVKAMLEESLKVARQKHDSGSSQGSFMQTSFRSPPPLQRWSTRGGFNDRSIDQSSYTTRSEAPHHARTPSATFSSAFELEALAGQTENLDLREPKIGEP